MPVMDGYQLIKLVRETSPTIKILCMSGFAGTSVPADVEFLLKPFPPNVLLARVDQLLHRG